MTNAKRPGFLITALGLASLIWGPFGHRSEDVAPETIPVAPPLAWLPGRSWLPFAVGVIAALLLLAWGLLAPSGSVGAGWLIGFLFWLGIAVGSLILLTIHGLTGGRWAAAGWPALAPAAATVPIFALFGLPLIFILPWLFRWAADPASAAPGVAEAYLNPRDWIVRAGVALLGWSVLAVLVLRRPGPHPLVAAAGLCFHAVMITLVGVDWVLSADPRFYSTAFGAALAAIQILSALAWVAALQVVPAGGLGKSGDIGGLIIAMALGSLYLGFSQYLVIWYGNIPSRAEWYIDRQQGAWLWLDLAAILLSGIVPLAVLMKQGWRNAPNVLSLVGTGVLIGVFAHILWLLGPPYGPLTAASALLALVAIGGPWLTLAYGFMAPRLEASHGAPG